MLGFLIDDEEFEVKPAISRLFLLNEFMGLKPISKTYNKGVDIKTVTFIADGLQTAFSVGETIGYLFYVSVNGLLEERDVTYFHIGQTSKVTFVNPPLEGSTVMISYFPGRTGAVVDNYGTARFFDTNYFIYDGSTLTFTVDNTINSVLHVDINGLVDEEGGGFGISGDNTVTLLSAPVIGSRIGITYMY